MTACEIGMFDVEQCKKVIDVSRKYLIDINKKKKKHGGIYERNRMAKN